MSNLTEPEILLQGEIARTEQLVAQHESKLPVAQRTYESASAKADKVWGRIIPKYDRIEDAPDKLQEQLRLAQREADHRLREYWGLMDAIRGSNAQIERLRSPAELERRLQTREHIVALRGRYGMADKAAKQSARDQGVPDVYLGDGGNFKPGLDARYKSDLILSIVGAKPAEEKKMLNTFTATDAAKRLEQRGWTSFLERKQEIIAEKESKAEAKKAEAAAKIEEKKAAAAAKAEEKAAAKAAGGDTNSEVKADPKPTSGRKGGRGK